MANPLVAPDDDDYERNFAVLALPESLVTDIFVSPLLVAPENFSNFIFPVGFGSA